MFLCGINKRYPQSSPNTPSHLEFCIRSVSGAFQFLFIFYIFPSTDELGKMFRLCKTKLVFTTMDMVEVVKELDYEMVC